MIYLAQLRSSLGLMHPHKQLRPCTTLLRALHVVVVQTSTKSAIFSSISEVNLRWPYKFCLHDGLVRAIFVVVVLVIFGCLHVDGNLGLTSAIRGVFAVPLRIALTRRPFRCNICCWSSSHIWSSARRLKFALLSATFADVMRSCTVVLRFRALF